MIDWLYQAKEVSKKQLKENPTKGKLSCQVYKPMTEFPFGQSIKKPFYELKVVRSEEENCFQVIELEEEKFLSQKEFEKIQAKLRTKRGLPIQWGLWIVAYSRLEMIEMMDKIGFKNVVYGDTDCVKFLGEEGNKIMEQRNKEIEKEFKELFKRKKIKMDDKLGKWKFEGLFPKFKTIGVKQYIKQDWNGVIETTCSGAEKRSMELFFRNVNNPFERFTKQMRVPGIYIKRVKKGDGVEFGYVNEIPENIQRVLKGHNTHLREEF